MKKNLKKLLELIKGYEIQFILLIVLIMSLNTLLHNSIEIINAFFKGIVLMINEAFVRWL